MGRGEIPWVGGSIYYGRGSKYHEYGGRNTMGKGDKNDMGKWINIPWAGGQNGSIPNCRVQLADSQISDI